MSKSTPAASASSPAAVQTLLRELLAEIRGTVLSTLLEMLQQQKRNQERLGEIVASLQDQNNLLKQLSIDVDQNNQDIQSVASALNSNVAALNEAVSSLKQQNPNLDLTVLNACIKSLEQNHQKMVDLASTATAATAAAQTALSAGQQGISASQVGALGATNQTVDPNTLTDPSKPESQPAPSPNLIYPGTPAPAAQGSAAPQTDATAQNAGVQDPEPPEGADAATV